MRDMPIVWQRLMSPAGETCVRCAGTEHEVERAVAVLSEALRPLGIRPLLNTREIDESAFRARPSESNRIWIAARPIEDWLAGTVASSPCCSVCGDAECRTLEVGGQVFETIPERLVVRAGLIAAAHLLE